MNKPIDLAQWEEQINALLDGELEPEQAERLKNSASNNQALADAIVEAYQLQQALASIEIEPAPASLQRKLKAVPREHQPARKHWLQPRWAMALASIPLAVLVALNPLGSSEPSPEEIAQATQDLALALAYLDKANQAAERQILSTFNENISVPVRITTTRTLAEQFDLDKEQET